MNKKIIVDGNEIEVQVISQSRDKLEFVLNGKKYSFFKKDHRGEKFNMEFRVNTIQASVSNFSRKGEKQVFSDHLESIVRLPGKVKSSQAQVSSVGSLKSPMPGKIFKVLVDIGTKITKGDPILILEAMKMEHTIKAHQDGVLKEVFYNVGDQVTGGVELCEISQ